MLWFTFCLTSHSLSCSTVKLSCRVSLCAGNGRWSSWACTAMLFPSALWPRERCTSSEVCLPCWAHPAVTGWPTNCSVIAPAAWRLGHLLRMITTAVKGPAAKTLTKQHFSWHNSVICCWSFPIRKRWMKLHTLQQVYQKLFYEAIYSKL